MSCFAGSGKNGHVARVTDTVSARFRQPRAVAIDPSDGSVIVGDEACICRIKNGRYTERMTLWQAPSIDWLIII